MNTTWIAFIVVLFGPAAGATRLSVSGVAVPTFRFIANANNVDGLVPAPKSNGTGVVYLGEARQYFAE